MMLIFTILSLWLVLCAADNSLSLNGAQIPDGNFDGEYPNADGPKIAKHIVTNRHRTPSTYNPCDHKECSPGYSCKAIVNQYLLQVSVAVCVSDFVIKIANNSPCITIILGGDQMGCKTQSEWETIGMIQCGIRVTSNAAYHHKTKAHSRCPYDRYNPEYTFMQAEINCCPAEATTATPQDDHNVTPDQNINPNQDDAKEKDSSQERNKNTTIITAASIGFAIVGLILLMVGCLAYKKYQQNLPTKLHPTDGGMSFINPNSDAYEGCDFDPKKPLVMYPDGTNSFKDYVVENPLVSSK